MSKQSLKTSGGGQATAVASAPISAKPSPPAPVDEPAPVNEQDVAALAYQRWLERGCPHGSPEKDWYAAERELQSKSNSS